MCFPSVGDDWLRMALGRTSSSVMVTGSGCLNGLIGIHWIIHTVSGWLTRVGLLECVLWLCPGGWDHGSSTALVGLDWLF